MKEPDDLTTEFADELLRDMVEAEIAADVQQRRAETAFCVSQITLHNEAPSGWKQEWQAQGHNPGCRHCRRAAYVAFRNDRPGHWILQDRNNPECPQWWRDAIEDYLGETSE